jgi:hypothetical protein
MRMDDYMLLQLPALLFNLFPKFWCLIQCADAVIYEDSYQFLTY